MMFYKYFMVYPKYVPFVERKSQGGIIFTKHLKHVKLR